MRDPGPRPTNAEMASLVAKIDEPGLVEVYTDEQGREAYRRTEDGVWVGNMLSMDEDVEAFMRERDALVNRDISLCPMKIRPRAQCLIGRIRRACGCRDSTWAISG